MTTDKNPYESPTAESKTVDDALRLPIVAPRAIAFVIASSIACGLLGTFVGAGLGYFVPQYYQSVFSGGDSPSFDPVAVGIGQGMTQGVAAGLFLGVALVALQYWYNVRVSRIAAEPKSPRQ